MPLERCPPPVQAVFKRESFSDKLGTIGKDMKYGVTVYETQVHHRGKVYEIIIAEDGTLVEKVLVIDDEQIELEKCPGSVQTALKDHARGGTIGEIIHSTGITHPTFEAEIKIADKIYLVEVSDSGALISKSLEAAKE